MKFRKPTYEEFVGMVQKALMHEYDHYRQHVPKEKRQEVIDNIPDYLLENGSDSFVTEDGKSICVTMPNSDGTRYLYSVFVDEQQRNQGIGTAMIKRVMGNNPQGVTLHVSMADKDAYRLYTRLGFKPSGTGPCKTIFMATKKGLLGGKYEWGND